MPSVDDVERIVAIENPIIRNLEITYCYSRLAAVCAKRNGEGASWCTYATWASRQAGGTIRGEDLLENLESRLGKSRWVLHPVATLWRRLLRRGLFQPKTRLGRLTAELHTPFDAFERASDAVARGNLKVFEEIGLQFARYVNDSRLELRPGDPPEGQRLLSQAFAHYEQLRSERDLKRRAELDVLANLEIGLHEQTRLQQQILEALDAGFETQEDLGRRALEALVPSAPQWWRLLRGPATAVIGVLARDPASFEQDCARGDHRLDDGPGAPGKGVGSRPEPHRPVPGGARRPHRPGAEGAPSAVRADSAGSG